MQSSQGYLRVTWLEMHCNTDLATAPHLTPDGLPPVISCSGDLPYHGIIFADRDPPESPNYVLGPISHLTRKLSSHDRGSCVWRSCQTFRLTSTLHISSKPLPAPHESAKTSRVPVFSANYLISKTTFYALISRVEGRA